ncbi:MAG: hypothetical protein Q8O55_06920 [Dehalococcoidales bacterium]|nr:hypothetical protein [Dehalococcoidales bacterium]
MADELAKKIAEAKKKMFGDLQPSGGNVVMLVQGEGKVECGDKKIEIRNMK